MDKPPQPGFIPPPPYSPQSQPQPTYAPPTPQPNVVIVQQATTQFGPESQPMTCPHCQMQISTRIETETTSKTHMFALLLCLIGCWPCVPCPYCIDSCMAKKHYCPNCQAYLGEYNN